MAVFHLSCIALWADPLHLRVVTGNLSSGRYQKYDDGPGARIFQGLKPDIALIQEFRVGDSTETQIKSWVQSVFGPDFYYYRQEAPLPNGIVSRYPIESSGFWKDKDMENRDFAWARIKLPDGQRILAVSLHLSASKEAKRRSETQSVANYCKTNLAADEWLIIGGDLNTQVRNESCVRSLSAVVHTEAPYPTDEAGNENTNAGRRKPTDWLLVNVALQSLKIPNSLTGTGDLVFDSRVFSDLSKVPPILAEDSAAEQMQHMAIVRDFLIPESKPEASN